MQDDVPEGSASDRAYLIPYAEDLWKGLPEETKEHCRKTWIERAQALPNVRWVVLRLEPDEIFPSGVHETPYVEWRHEIVRDADVKYTFSGSVNIYLKLNVELTPMLRMEVERKVRASYPKGTEWRVVVGETEVANGRL